MLAVRGRRQAGADGAARGVGGEAAGVARCPGTRRKQTLCEMEVELTVPLPYKMSAGYLGAILQSDGGCEDDLAARMRAARRRFNELKWMFADRELGTEMKRGLLIKFAMEGELFF
eukprot:SAG11_NODE_813_length_7054_cov_5.253774_1_plen_116_part_00